MVLFHIHLVSPTSALKTLLSHPNYPTPLYSMVLELNASDDRGIGIVRGQILSFASTKTIFKSGFKLIILDEADAMTNDAQNALRRIIEKFTENVRFCIICNYLSKIIPAVQSRCTRFRFGPLSPVQIMPRLQYIIQQEHVSATEDGKKALLTLSGGDMRKVINILQSTAMAYKEVTEDNVYTCVGHPLKSDIANVVQWLLSDTFSASYNSILHNSPKTTGLPLKDIVLEYSVTTSTMRQLVVVNATVRPVMVVTVELPAEGKVGLLVAMSDMEHRLCRGAGENAQLGGLIAAFHMVRELVPMEATAT
ncbi:hypothetical protein PR048_020669 [Dryococelus australis]|uniref:Replication factor C C-terminal domain-containing protein n=1 Tax=Dryococelus australis TaxID=614101 RepID=A0ABQ9H711_9NEOP|nr:hypothetical protein PR048_020669 [Dryococelus australis]